MKPIAVLAGLTTLLLTAPLIKASASPPPMDVTPEYSKTLPYTFAFTSVDRDGLKHIGVTIALKKDSRRPEPLWSRYHRCRRFCICSMTKWNLPPCRWKKRRRAAK